MEQPASEPGEGSYRGAYSAVGSETDSCVAGQRIPTFDVEHRGVLSDVRLHDIVDVLHEIEEFVRRNPWPMLALGFAAGYVLSRSKVR